ncbi:hypothetical protein BV20DRAFT_363771 [Pilatotrama ljubarskyi]|nr:hypothetical protein BV20DRAFT_363771 [Pilatotrama ljubarskyi]
MRTFLSFFSLRLVIFIVSLSTPTSRITVQNAHMLSVPVVRLCLALAQYLIRWLSTIILRLSLYMTTALSLLSSHLSRLPVSRVCKASCVEHIPCHSPSLSRYPADECVMRTCNSQLM